MRINQIDVKRFVENINSEQEFKSNIENCLSWVMNEFSKSDFFFSFDEETKEGLKYMIESYYQSSSD